MTGIIFEGVLFVALIAAGGTLLSFLALHYTPLGTRLRQIRNRKSIEHTAELMCPMHGEHREDQMVRLPNGERICPECFKEIVWPSP